MEIKGAILLIGQTESKGSGNFTTRQLVLSTHEQYPQKVPIDFVKDKTSILDHFQPGQDVSVSINIRGNEYNGKFYCNLQGWKIDRI